MTIVGNYICHAGENECIDNQGCTYVKVRVKKISNNYLNVDKFVETNIKGIIYVVYVYAIREGVAGNGCRWR